MPKYNLMEDMDSEEKDSPKPPPDDEEKKISEDEVDDTKLSDYIVEDIVISEPEMDSVEEKPETPEADREPEPPAVSTDAPADVPNDFTDHERYTVPEGTPPMQPFDLGSDYEDEKQPGLNYKPIVIGIAAVAAVAIIYFAIDYFFLSGDAADETEVVTETPEQKLQREREERKQAFLSNLSTKNKHRVSYISSLVNLNTGDVKFSSMLLYDNSFNFEIFAKNRDKLAQFNVQLKDNTKLKNYKIETAENRPGSKGGVFALYNLDMGAAPGGPTSGTQKAASTTPANWIASSGNQFGLSVQSQRQISSRTESQFSVTRHEIIFEGAESSCTNLVKQIVAQNSNIYTHKLILLPRNQRDMSNSAYELRLILDFYM